MEKHTFMEGKSPASKGRSIRWLWWLLLSVLAAWSIWTLWPKNPVGLNLSYTAFLDQVRAGNVTQVSIVGDLITGEFRKTIAQPQNRTTTSPPARSQVSYNTFQTNYPDVVGDPGLIGLLDTHQVTVNVTPRPNPWLTLGMRGFPLLLFMLASVWIGGQVYRNQTNLMRLQQNRARHVSIEQPEVTFEDVAGASEAKQALKEVIDFLKNPQKYRELGARLPRAVLLLGPPGTGKTLIARAVAGEAHAHFYAINTPELIETLTREGACQVHDLFNYARAAGPGIVLIEELDSLGRRHRAGSGGGNDEREKILAQLLVEMDSIDSRHEIVLLATTNQPGMLDPALLRPGRFERQITLGLPDRRAREGILRIHTQPLRLAHDVELSLVARTTTGFSGADLTNLCNEAALIAAQENHLQISMTDFEEALDRILKGATRTFLLDDEDRRVVAYHEAGHALVAWLTPYADPVHTVSILPRNWNIDITEQLAGDDEFIHHSRSSLLARLSVILGGRAAEELATGDITTSAKNDLVEATRLAHRMIARWGMGSLGPIALSTDGETPLLGHDAAQGRNYSEETAAHIDQDVQKLLVDRYQLVQHLLEGERSKLDSLVSALLKEETIDRKSLMSILGPRLPIETHQEMNPEVTV